MKSQQVDILLATYNGERYIEKLLNSLIVQSHKDWKLYIRDDGSADSTIKIIKSKLSLKYNYEIIQDNKGKLGPCFNFLELLKYSKSNYTLFCDQDDIWLPNKIELLLGKIQNLEHSNNSFTPILIHSDLELIDENGLLIHRSFWKFQNINPKRTEFKDILMQNNVTGCATIFNLALRKKIMKNDNIQIHDWWLALIASKFGEVHYLRESTIQYRQHKSNSIGAKKYSLLTKNPIKTLRENIKSIQSQSEAFLDGYSEALTHKEKELLKNLSSFSNLTFFQKRKVLLVNKLRKQGLLRIIAFYFFA